MRLEVNNDDLSAAAPETHGVDSMNDRDYGVIHPPGEAPLCEECQRTELAYFDLSCLRCLQQLLHPETSVSQILAVMRQWNPHTQRSIKFCIQQVLEKGGRVNDRDSVSDMTLLHFACKAGAAGIGDPQAAVEVVKDLIQRGADVYARCRWTHMTPLHYAALFDAAPIVRILLNTSQGLDIDSPCNDYENGSALHIAAANLSFHSAQVLVENGANTKLRDNLGRIPLECIPEADKYEHLPQTDEILNQLRGILSREPRGKFSVQRTAAAESIAGKAFLRTMALNLGDRILIDKRKMGTLRYCGTVDFASGIWVGVELDTPDGKNDGIVQDTFYFKCSPNHGIFVPVNRVSRVTNPKNVNPVSHNSISPSHSNAPCPSTPTRRNSSRNSSGSIKLEAEDISLNERVSVLTLNGERFSGTVRFKGETKFAKGVWFGVELDDPQGRNNGSVQGSQYFQCKEKHGIFATASRLRKIDDKKESTPDRDSGLVKRSSTLPRVTQKRSSVTLHTGDSNGSAVRESSFKNGASCVEQQKVQNLSSSKENSKPEWKSVPVEPLRPQKKKTDQHWLEVGMNVLFNHHVGIIKYIGTADFADGVWLGLELRDGSGRHDGKVNGRRYFQCKPTRGIMVRPQSVTVRGINGALLVKPAT